MIDGKKVIAITLARGGSKSIPKKNICILSGKPLLWYTLKEVERSKYIDEYYISTDDDEIETVCHQYGVRVKRRPVELATDRATSAAALVHVAYDCKCDYLIEVMCTNPLKTVEDIDGCILKLHKTGVDSVVSVVRVYDHHPARVKYVQNDILCDFYPEVPESRRQDLLPPAYVRNGSIYAMKYSFLLENKTRYDKRTSPYVMPQERTVNIDDPSDLQYAEFLLQKADCGRMQHS